MKRMRQSVCLGVALWFLVGGMGCGSMPGLRRAGGVMLGAGAGALAGKEIADGKPGGLVVGGAVGAALGSLAQGRDAETLRLGYEEGYQRGEADAVKRHYFLRLSAERQEPHAEKKSRSRLYLVPGPTQLPDGTRLAPHVLPVRIEE